MMAMDNKSLNSIFLGENIVHPDSKGSNEQKTV